MYSMSSSTPQSHAIVEDGCISARRFAIWIKFQLQIYLEMLKNEEESVHARENKLLTRLEPEIGLESREEV